MHICNRPIEFLMSLLLAVMCSTIATADDTTGFRPMVNGNDLTGWVLVNTPPETWSFQDGMLVCTGKPIGEIRTAEMYQNFIMEVEWRHMVPKGNAGIFVWADDITAKGQPFHRGIEVQVLENAYGNNRSHTTHGDIFPIHGAKMTPVNGHGGSRAFPTEERAKPSPEWNHYRIECNDGAISLAVNGKVVTRGLNCSPKKGYICIESEGGVVHYRNMKIKRLPDTPVDAQDIATTNRNFRSVYSGLNLDGWQTSQPDAWKVQDWVLAFAEASAAADSSLTLQQSLPANVGIIVDVKLVKDSSAAVIQLMAEDGSIASIDLNEPAIKNSLDKVGRWNRVEASVADGKFALTCNNVVVFEDRAVAAIGKKWTLKLVPTGQVHFANIYVRKQ